MPGSRACTTSQTPRPSRLDRGSGTCTASSRAESLRRACRSPLAPARGAESDAWWVSRRPAQSTRRTTTSGPSDPCNNKKARCRWRARPRRPRCPRGGLRCRVAHLVLESAREHDDALLLCVVLQEQLALDIGALRDAENQAPHAYRQSRDMSLLHARHALCYVSGVAAASVRPESAAAILRISWTQPSPPLGEPRRVLLGLA